MKRFVVVVLVLFASEASAQHWKKIQDLGLPLTTPYFVNPDTGFVFHAGLYFVGIDTEGSHFQRTTDGGITWLSLGFFDSLRVAISQISFDSPRHGYAAALDLRQRHTGGIYETSDMGDHWRLITPRGQSYLSVYATHGIVCAIDFANLGVPYVMPTGHYVMSSDNGNTWHEVPPPAGLKNNGNSGFQWCYGNLDSILASVYFDSTTRPNDFPSFNTYLIFSTDLGKTWQTTGLDTIMRWYSVSLFIAPHTCQVIRQYVPMTDRIGDTYQFLSGYAPFKSWSSSIASKETGQWIAGKGCATYLCTATDDNFLYRSLDAGHSWPVTAPVIDVPSVFGEIDDVDWHNLSVVGNGAIVYAADRYGDLWKTTDGGDGSLSAAALAPRFALDHTPFASGNDTLFVNGCTQSLLEVHNLNIGCSYGKFDSISIDGLARSEYSIVSTHHCGCVPMPDTSLITLSPKDTGTQNLVVHYHFTDDEYNQIDTTISITLVAKPSGNSIALNLYLKSNSINIRAGDTVDVPVYLSGDGTVDSLATNVSILIHKRAVVPIDFVPARGEVTSGTIGQQDDTVTAPLQIRELALNGEVLLGWYRCIVYLADTLETSLSLKGADFSSNSPQCLALSTSAGQLDIKLIGCGDSTLLRAMRGESPFYISGVTPNPAGNSILAKFYNPQGQVVSYSIVNAVGTKVKAGEFAGAILEQEVASLPNGVYMLQAQTAASAMASFRFVVNR